MKKKKIYIAGKVGGEDTATVTMKFGKAQKKLEAEGYDVINPLQVVASGISGRRGSWIKTPWPIAMKLCIAAMMDADEVYMLTDWRYSSGATIEHDIATKLKMQINYQ